MSTSPSPLQDLHKQPIVRFAGVGVISTAIDILLLNVLTKLGTPEWFAVGVAFLAGTTNGYFMNNALVFAKETSATRYTKYLGVSAGGLLWTELIVHLLRGHLGLNGSKLVAVVIVFFWNYGLSKVWAFK